MPTPVAGPVARRPPVFRSTISLKFALLVAAVFGVALGALFLVQRTQRSSIAALLESESRERSGMMSRVIGLTGQSLRDFTFDYAQWDDMVEFARHPRAEWAAINIDASLDDFHLAAVWVLRPDGSLIYATRGENVRGAPPPLPLSADRLPAAAGKSAFAQTPEGLLELCLAPLQPSADTQRQTSPQGWLLAARLWDETQLRTLAEIIQCEVALVSPASEPPRSTPNQISLLHPLLGADGRAVASLLYTVKSHELEIMSAGHRTELAVFVATSLLAALLVTCFLYRSLIRPLNVIGESLVRHDPLPILPLLARSDEMGRLAHLVKTSFDQRAELEKALEERARLGRELHDGVIQTVYAAGMNLAAARAALRRDPAGVERMLDDTHAELNSTIRDLRNFISGAEPEPAGRRTFRDAMQSIVTLMRGVGPLTGTLELDDDLAAGLTRAQRLHLLQVTREAVSNSVRHGKARHVRIQLRREQAGVVLEIEDDGIGLPEASSEGGRGLANLAARAGELGGTLHLSPRAEGGVGLRLVFPFLASARR